MQDILIGNGKLTGTNSVEYSLPGRVDIGGKVTARDIIIATGSVPFVPPGSSKYGLHSGAILRALAAERHVARYRPVPHLAS